MDIDDRWLDYDFPLDGRYSCGYTGAPTNRRNYASADDVLPLVPEGMWQEECERLEAAGGGLDRMVTRIFNQKNEGSCVANATAQQHQISQAAQFGRDRVVQLSAISLYKQIGSSPSSGAMVDDALDCGTETGILPLDTPENRQKFKHVMPATGFHTPYPDGWKQTAKLFRFDERVIVKSLAAMISCVLRGFAVVVGRDGHSILYVRPRYVNGRLVMKYVNSWSEDWGEGFGDFAGGFGYDSLSTIKDAADWAFASRTLIVPDVFNIVI